MRGRIGRREGSCGGGMSRGDGDAVGLYIDGTVKAVLGLREDPKGMLCYDSGGTSWRRYVCDHTF